MRRASMPTTSGATVLSISAAVPRRRQTGDAVADDAGIGLDLGEHDRTAEGLVDARRLDRHRRIECVSGDADNFHWTPGCVLRAIFCRTGAIRHSSSGPKPATMRYNLLVTSVVDGRVPPSHKVAVRKFRHQEDAT